MGGMASVHRAKKRGPAGFERTVALKRMLLAPRRGRGFIESFVREAKLASLLVHPNIAQIYDLGRIGGVYFIAMELVAGSTFASSCATRTARNEPIPLPVVLLAPRRAVRRARLRAHVRRRARPAARHRPPRRLAVEHDRRAHRSRSRSSTSASRRRSSRQLHTETGLVKGKLGYMAPEAALGHAGRAGSDVFSVGVVAWELVTAPAAVLVAHRLRDDATPPRGARPAAIAAQRELPAGSTTLILAALARDVEKRITSARAFRAGLDNMIAQYNIQASARVVAEWMKRFVATERTARAATAADPNRPRSPSGQSRPLPRTEARTSVSRPVRAGTVPPPLRRSTDDIQLATEIWGEDATQHPDVAAGPDFSAMGHDVLDQGIAGKLAQAHVYTPPPYNTGVPRSRRSRRRSRSSRRRSRTCRRRSPLRSSAHRRRNRCRTRTPARGRRSRSRRRSSCSPCSLCSRVRSPRWSLRNARHRRRAQRWCSRPSPPDRSSRSAASLSARAHRSRPTSRRASTRSRSSTTATGRGPVRLRCAPANASRSTSPSRRASSRSPRSRRSATRSRRIRATPNERQCAELEHRDRQRPRPTQARRRGSNTGTKSASRDRGKHPDKSHHVVESPPVETPHLDATKADSNKADPNKADANKADPNKDPTKVDPTKVTTKPLNDTKLEPLARMPVVAASAVSKVSGEVPVLRGSSGSGEVLAKMCIDESGKVTSVKIVKSPPEISADLQRALMGWRYAPYKNKDSKVSPVCFPLTLRVVLEELADIGVAEVDHENVRIGERAQRDLRRADPAAHDQRAIVAEIVAPVRIAPRQRTRHQDRHLAGQRDVSAVRVSAQREIERLVAQTASSPRAHARGRRASNRSRETAAAAARCPSTDRRLPTSATCGNTSTRSFTSMRTPALSSARAIAASSAHRS